MSVWRWLPVFLFSEFPLSLRKLKWSNIGVMNTPLTVPSDADRLSGDSIPTSARTPLDEQGLVELYINLTGATESEARDVFIFIFHDREDITPIPSA